MEFVWRSEENLWDSVLTFHHVGPRDGTQSLDSAASVPAN